MQHNNLHGADIADHFNELGACEPAMDWLWDTQPPTLRHAIQSCDQVQWLIWAAKQSPLFTDAIQPIETACDTASKKYIQIKAKASPYGEYVEQMNATTDERLKAIKTALLACIKEDDSAQQLKDMIGDEGEDDGRYDSVE